jgi:hypothetical protein
MKKEQSQGRFRTMYSRTMQNIDHTERGCGETASSGPIERWHQSAVSWQLKNYVETLMNGAAFNRTSTSRTVPNRAFQWPIRFGSNTIRTVHCRARALGTPIRFGSRSKIPSE